METFKFKIIDDDKVRNWEGEIKIINGSKETFILVNDEGTHSSCLLIDEFFSKITSKLEEKGYKYADKYYMFALEPAKKLGLANAQFHRIAPDGQHAEISKDTIIEKMGCSEGDLDF